MKKSNDEVLAGKSRSRPAHGAGPMACPGFCCIRSTDLLHQTANEVVMSWGQDFQLRRVYLNVPHSANVKPSWYGESVGHYENGDTLVVDTIGLNDKSYVDNFRTPHTTQLHVVERFNSSMTATGWKSRFTSRIPAPSRCRGTR
jgi:hypothetical protein